jgi:chromosomal replication initiation ATPase DnaA
MKPWFSQWHGLQTPTKPVRGSCGAEARRLLAERAADFQVTVSDLVGDSRKRAVAWPRQAIMAELYETGRYSLPAIGRLFNRDHSTVMHGVRRHAERART